MAEKIAVLSGKGGVSKSLTSEELACCFTDMGYKVLCIDMDMQTDLTSNSGAEVKNTIFDVFNQTIAPLESIQHTPYYDIISGDIRLQNAEKVFTEADDVYLLADVCEIIEAEYDYIFIDNHPDRALPNIMSTIAADYVVTPTLVDDNSLRGVVSIANDLKKMREGRNNKTNAYILAIILNMYKKTNAHKKALDVLNQLAEKLPGDVIVDTVRESIKVTESRSLKEPMQRYDKFNNVSLDYRRIAKKMEEIINGSK